MSPLTERDNVLKVYAGERPDWVPLAHKAFAIGMPMAIRNNRGDAGGRIPGAIIYNILKTPHMIPPDPNIGAMPVPGEPHIPDITRWREFLDFPFPDPHKLDWSDDEAAAGRLDRENKAVMAMIGGAQFAGAPFNAMVDLMGHEAASIAMLDDDEKESWHELLGFLTEWELAVLDHMIEIYKPDIVCTSDDLANAHGPFMSIPTYREMIAPYQGQIFDRINAAGIICELHCCGRAEDFVADWVKMGLAAWNPAQTMNDLQALQARYGFDFIIDGGYDSQSRINTKGAKEEDVRASIRLSFEKYAPAGNFIFSTSGMALAHELGEDHMNWIFDEAEKCSTQSYG
ncbi:MAG: hypothetical protein FWD45_06415 [Coriobacteriia bacterium]|nr:hypothetical protein [Coriobacteriia bacterium]